MFSDFLKSVLVFNRSQNKAPNFFLVYLIIWLVWHGQFFISLITSNGAIDERLQSALEATNHQYIAVFFVTLLFFGVRLAYLYFANKTNDFIEKDKPIEEKIGSDQLFKENKDVVRLLELLEETKMQLAEVKEREKKAKAEKLAAVNQMLAVKNELDLALADIEILNKANNDLTAKLRESTIA